MKTAQFRNFKAALVSRTLFFSSALACKTVSSATLRREWRKLVAKFADRLSALEEIQP
jgi:hypothetical protein